MSKDIKRGNGKEYTADTFESHEGLDGIRVRPTVYIGSIHKEGVFRIFLEAVGNIIDEFNAGRCDTARISIDPKTCHFVVEDTALGIPIEKFHDALTKLHTGGKFGKSTYDYSIGLNGLGLKCINALSDKFIVDTYFNGKHGHFYSEKSIEKDFWIKDDTTHPSGTRVEWIPDESVLEELGVDYDRYSKTLNMNTYINPGFRIDLDWGGKVETYYHPEGMEGYYATIAKKNKIHLVMPAISFSNSTSIPSNKHPNKTTNMNYTIYLSWAENLKSEYVESYVNGFRTINGGTHVTGVHMAITKALKDYIDKNNILPAKSKLEIDGNDVRETLMLIVNANHSEPQYTTQVKDALDNKDIQFFTSSSVYPALQVWLTNHKKEADLICKLVIRSAKAREAAKNAKDNIIKANNKLGLGNLNLDKYNGCRSRNPEESELFIVEGDSAGGSAKKARSSENQAVFRIRGKIQNVMASKSPTFSDELTTLVEVMGCGIGPTFNINKLRFHKIIFGTDADPDGYDIKLLLSGFFFKYYRPLIEAGYIYEAMPPLFQLTFGSGANARTVFLPDQESFNLAISHIATEAFDLETLNGTKLSKKIAKNYINALLDFKLFMEQMRDQTNVDAELLEYIVRYYKDICNKDFRKMEALNYACTIVHEGSDHLHINVDRDYEHYFVTLDNRFYQTVYKPISERLGMIKLMDIFFVGKKTGQKYGGNSWRNANFIEGLLLGRGVKVTRVKGLGESNAAELRYYMFNESTRTIRQLRMDDAAKAAEVFDMCLGKAIEERKKFCMTGE